MVTDVKQGSRVVYAANGVEREAIALGEPTVGVNSGTKSASHYLNLVYLNDAGEPVKVMGVPLVTAAATPEMLDQYAALNAAAEQRPGPERDQARERWRKQLEDVPRTTGWRPYVAGEAVRVLQDEVEHLLEIKLDYEQKAKEEAAIPVTTRFLALLENFEVRAFVKAPENHQKINDAMGHGLDTEDSDNLSDPKPPAETHLPSAADLDAVAEETAAKAATESLVRVDDEGTVHPIDPTSMASVNAAQELSAAMAAKAETEAGSALGDPNAENQSQESVAAETQAMEAATDAAAKPDENAGGHV